MRNFNAIRLAACSLVASAIICGIGFCCYAQADQSRSECLIERQRLDEESAKHDQFHREMTRIFADVKEGGLPLSEAVDRVEKASQKYSPVYLKHLASRKTSHGLREAIADNIIAHFSAETKTKRNTQWANEVVARLKIEQVDMFSQQTQVSTDH